MLTSVGQGREFKFLSREGVSDSIPRPISSRSVSLHSNRGSLSPSLTFLVGIMNTRIPKILEPPQTVPENGAVPGGGGMAAVKNQSLML